MTSPNAPGPVATSPVSTVSVTIRGVIALLVAIVLFAVLPQALGGADGYRDGQLVVGVVCAVAAAGQLLTAWSAATLLAATRTTPPAATRLRQSLRTFRLSRIWVAVDILVGLGFGGVVAAVNHTLAPLGFGAYAGGILTLVHALVLRHQGRQIGMARHAGQP